MPHDALKTVTKKDAKRLLATEAKRRRNGDWGIWEVIPLEGAGPSSGWLRKCVRAHRNKVFSVLERPVGDVTHLAITSLSLRRPTWWEAQRIKDDIAGQSATAVEVYPPRDQVVDGADMYHLWVLPEPLPFGLRK